MILGMGRLLGMFDDEVLATNDIHIQLSQTRIIQVQTRCAQSLFEHQNIKMALFIARAIIEKSRNARVIVKIHANGAKIVQQGRVTGHHCTMNNSCLLVASCYAYGLLPLLPLRTTLYFRDSLIDARRIKISLCMLSNSNEDKLETVCHFIVV